MKTLAILIFLCAPLYGADAITTNIVGDMTTTGSERSGRDGKPYLRIQTVHRGNTRVFQTTSGRNQQGTMLVVSRSYFTNGKLLTAESDEKADGFFECVAVFDPSTDDFEVFTRQPDGSVKPVSTQTLQVSKKQNAPVSEFFSRALQEKRLSDEKFEELFRQTRERILDAEQEKTDEKK
jgi:hypothetical protein